MYYKQIPTDTNDWLARTDADSDTAHHSRRDGRTSGRPYPRLVLNELPLLRLRALLAKAHGDEVAYRDFRDRYRAMATSLGFEGHMK